MIFEPLNYNLSFDNYIWYQVIGIHKMLIKISIYPDLTVVKDLE
jgi:hypothetical protein